MRPGPEASAAATGAGTGPDGAPQRGQFGRAAPTWGKAWRLRKGPSSRPSHRGSSSHEPVSFPIFQMPPSHQSSMTPWSSGICSSACFSRFDSFFRVCPMLSFCSFSWDTWICSSSGGYRGRQLQGPHLKDATLKASIDFPITLPVSDTHRTQLPQLLPFLCGVFPRFQTLVFRSGHPPC